MPSTGSWKNYSVSGENLPTGDFIHSEKSFIITTKRYMFLIQVGTALTHASNMAKIMQINPIDSSGQLRILNADPTKEFGSFLFDSSDAGTGQSQWRIDPTWSAIAEDDSAARKIGVDWQTPLFVHYTLRFQNRGTKEITLLYKFFQAGEDRAAVLKNLTDVINKASVLTPWEEAFIFLKGYPGMHEKRMGPDTANGLPNIAFVDFKCNTHKLMNDYMYKEGKSIGADFSATNQRWLYPVSPEDAAAHDYSTDSYSDCPMFVMWAFTDAGFYQFADSLFVEGTAKITSKCFREVGWEMYYPTDASAGA